MKFLVKSDQSPILTEGLVYKEKATVNNLLKEQRGFCAYTEQRLNGPDGERIALHSVEVEHLDAAKKYSDDYYNYYAVIRDANSRKIARDHKYGGASFLEDRFFQKPGGFQERIQYIAAENVYEEIQPEDQEAADFIEFLGLNDAKLVSARKGHVRRMCGLFNDASFAETKQLAHFANDPGSLSFITALEAALNIDLEHLLGSTT